MFLVQSTYVNKFSGCTPLRLRFCICKPEIFVARVPFWGYTVRTIDKIYLMAVLLVFLVFLVFLSLISGNYIHWVFVLLFFFLCYLIHYYMNWFKDFNIFLNFCFNNMFIVLYLIISFYHCSKVKWVINRILYKNIFQALRFYIYIHCYILCCEGSH